MLALVQEKHLAYFDAKSKYFTSFTFSIKEGKVKDKDDSRDSVSIKAFNEDNNNEEPQEPKGVQAIPLFNFKVHVQHEYQFEWTSKYYDIELVSKKKEFGHLPLSLQTYFALLYNPCQLQFNLTIKQQYLQKSQFSLINQTIGKLSITTRFKGNPFKLPIYIIDSPRINTQCPKIVTVIAKNDNQSIVCSGQLLQTIIYSTVGNYQLEEDQTAKEGFKLFKFTIPQRVSSQNICIMKGKFISKEFIYEKITITIYTLKQQISFIPNLITILQSLKAIFGQLQQLKIIQGADTDLQDSYQMVFYTDLLSLYHKIYRSWLYDKIADRWLIEGMSHFNRSNKHFQDILSKLIELVTEGEELVPLQDQTYCFDEVWKIKARFVYHVLANFKTVRDYGSASLASLILDQAKKGKITSQLLFKKLKKSYGLNTFRTTYEGQFIKSTGINRIFCKLIDLRKQNKVKIIVRQKALATKIFKLYNMFRIKIQQNYNIVCPLTAKVYQKNEIVSNGRKKELLGPLAIPKDLKCLPFFKGTVAVQTDANDQPFELTLKQENIIQQKQNATAKNRAPTRKIGQNQKAYDGFSWVMIDTAHTFPAVYKNENVHESVILQKVKKRYDSEQQQIKVLNCISSKDHSSNEKICQALLDKIKISHQMKENCEINVKRKILQIIPIFLNRATDYKLWEDYLSLIKLYQPPCHDYSEKGFLFLLSLIQSLSQMEYRKAFNYYFQQFHKVLISLSRSYKCQNQQWDQRFKRQLFGSIMKWKSKYSFQILFEVRDMMILCLQDIKKNIQILKIILTGVLPYIKSLKLIVHQALVKELHQLIAQAIEKDKSYELYVIKFIFDFTQKEKILTLLQFLKETFKQIEECSQVSSVKYWKTLQAFKNILLNNKKRYGLQMQVDILNQNQNYFIAEYLWEQLISKESLQNPYIRLQWIKIYRVFYFYFTPMITIVKLDKNKKSKEFFLDQNETQLILDNLHNFMPDIKWYSGYTSRNAKDLIAKYDQLNENKRRRKIQDYTYSQNNIITKYLKEEKGKGRQTWEQISRQAIRICIQIYGEKQNSSDGPITEKYKAIEQGFKDIQAKLKRGRIQQYYTFGNVKDDINSLLQTYDEHEQRVNDIMMMVESALKDINDQKKKREDQIKNQMKIIISMDQIQEEENQNQNENENENENEANNEGNQDEIIEELQGQNEEDQDQEKEEEKIEQKDVDQEDYMFE